MCIGRGPEGSITLRTRRRLDRAPVQTFRAQGGLHEHRSREDPVGFLGGHMDTNRMFTSLFGGWLTAAD